jgi:FKBP-type peptidyl-prolyl cis-trans isomerase SlyD
MKRSSNAPKRLPAIPAGKPTPHPTRRQRAAPRDLRIAPNRFVSLECTLRDEEGEVIDVGEEDDAVDYVHGYGMLVPGLETALSGLVEGDQREILVPPASGYGERDEDLVMEVERSDFPNPDRVAKGDELEAEWPDGGSQTMRVVEVRPDSVIVDANHPLAGMALRYFVKVLRIRLASDAEIEKAAREVEEAEEQAQAEADQRASHTGCSHDHDHEGGHEKLITLGKGKSA